MSLETFARVWETSPASGNTLLVHLALADMARHKLVQVPQADIAELARCSIPTVSRCLQELISLGEVIAIDDRCKPPIYELQLDFQPARGTGSEPAPLRAGSVDNLQNDGILQPDRIGPLESGQIEGIAMERTEDVNSARDVRPPFEASLGLDVERPNIGQPIPVMEGPSAEVMVELRELQDEAHRAVKQMTGVENLVFENSPQVPRAPTTFRAMAGAAVQPKASDPVAELSAFLRALGVQPNPETPLYWYRDEHVKEFEILLRFSGKTPGELLDGVHQAGIKLPSIRGLRDVYDPLARAGIIPF